MDDNNVNDRNDETISPGENEFASPTLASVTDEHGSTTNTSTTSRSASQSFRFPRPQLAEVHRSRLRRSPKEMRQEHVDLSELRASLTKDGQLCPLFTVRTGEFIDGGGEICEILDGHRRFEASDGILEALQCFVFEPGIRPEDLVAFQLVVNVNRANLSQADQARAVFDLFKASGAATINEFVEGDHGLSFGRVWLRNLLVLGQAADKSASEIERGVFDRVQHGTLSVKKAAEELVALKRKPGESKPRRGRPKADGKPARTAAKSGTLVEVFIAEGFRISLKDFEKNGEVFGDWQLALIRKKKSRDLSPVPAAIQRAAEAIVALTSKDSPGLVQSSD
jgi:hypothetical protein